MDKYASPLFGFLLLFTTAGLLLFFTYGCSEPSAWEQQWTKAQEAIEHEEYSTAKTILQHLLSDSRQHTPGDVRHARVVFQLGEIARLEGQIGKAESYYWEALPLLAQSVGPEHLDMASPLLALAAIYQEKDQNQLALPLQKRALILQEKSWGASNPRLLPTLQRYHDLLRSLKQNTQAEEINSRIRHLMTLPP